MCPDSWAYNSSWGLTDLNVGVPTLIFAWPSLVYEEDWSFSLCVIVPQFRGYMTLWGETQLSSLSPFKTSCACACDLWTSHHPIFRVQYAATLWQTIIKHDFTSHSSHSTIVVTLLYFIFTSIDSKLIYIREWKFSAYFVFYTRLFSLIKKSERGLAVVTLHEREPSK